MVHLSRMPRYGPNGSENNLWEHLIYCQFWAVIYSV